MTDDSAQAATRLLAPRRYDGLPSLRRAASALADELYNRPIAELPSKRPAERQAMRSISGLDRLPCVSGVTSERMRAVIATHQPGVVVIGRNEGDRLRRCLRSATGAGRIVVYVDSGSTDDSAAVARSLGAEVVTLDMHVPFTAARARNAGFERLCGLAPNCELVQFVDGDCELIDGWLDTASTFLHEHAQVAVVCGRLSERHPERSIYNRLCDREWDRPPGSALACGGIAMMRCDAFAAVRGFNPDIVAGEEPELCLRLRARGWQVWRLSDRMAWHDADILRFSQWWLRSTRSGYAYAQAAALPHPGQEWQSLRTRLSIGLWAAGIPVATMTALAVWGWAGLALLLAYPLQVLRLTLRGRGTWRDRLLHATFLVLSRFAELRGLLQFRARRRAGLAASTRFDYKA